MKKQRIFAVIAALAACGTMAMAGCKSTTDSTPADGTGAMTEADVAVVSTSLQTMADYSGGFTVKEQSALDYKVKGYSIYNSALTMTSFATCDEVSKKSGMGTTVEGTNLYAGMDCEMGYYTIPGADGYTQYIKYVDDSGSIYTGTRYASVAALNFYYTDFASCVQDELGLDLEEGAAVTTADGMAAFWQDMLQENIDLSASAYGLTFSFRSGECQTTTENGVTFYSFAAQASASADLSGTKYVEDINYTVNVYLDGVGDSAKVSKIQTDMEQIIIAMQDDGQRVYMTTTSSITDEFVYAYDASLIPEDFSGYTVEGTVVS